MKLKAPTEKETIIVLIVCLAGAILDVFFSHNQGKLMQILAIIWACGTAVILIYRLVRYFSKNKNDKVASDKHYEEIRP